MEEAMVHEILRILHAQVLVILIVELDLTHRSLNVSNQVH